MADARLGGVLYIGERNTSTLHFKVMRPIFFELHMSLVIILDGLLHQESTENPIRGPLSYATAAGKIISARRPSDVVEMAPDTPKGC